MKITKKMSAALLSGVMILAAPTKAEPGFYYGLTVGVSNYKTDAFGDPNSVSGTDFTLGGLIGYEFASNSKVTGAVELTLDKSQGKTFSVSGGFATTACTSFEPHWCEIDTVVRMRSVFKTPLKNDWTFVGSLGGVMVDGLLENGPGTFVSGRGTGFTVGLGAEKPMNKGTMRVEMVYDKILDDNRQPYTSIRELDFLSLRASYIF